MVIIISVKLSIGYCLRDSEFSSGRGTQSHCLCANGVLEVSCLAELLLCSLTCSNRQASAAEFAVFHIMTRILEATNTLFYPASW